MANNTVQETLSVTFMSFRERSAGIFVTSLSAAHARTPEGINPGDIGAYFRLAPIMELPGLILDDGVVVADQEHPDVPRNTTRIRIPHRKGSTPAIVYCLTRKADQEYKLSKREVYSLAAFPPMERLLDIEGLEIEHFVIGISYTRRRKNGSRGFTVRLLGGKIDFEQRKLYADYEDVIVSFDSQGGASSLDSTEPTGPQPSLTPRTQINS